MSHAEHTRENTHNGFDNSQDLLRTADVAALFQVSTRTGGQWRYPAEPIHRLVEAADRPSWFEYEAHR
jgi:hypothetical protein